ncbi:DUF4129 domain-containing protein [Thermus sp. CCB_US3_UF1]|uniref:DUF4129 domain-containing protein n=1 Tax=Thermus sp. CCB_US3_UF1 TaxID=1111069 RepID=UPI001E4A1197|nr:DUF4129 domain-containing protein [Thermus sp. CCB_US3_UF1]
MAAVLLWAALPRGGLALALGVGLIPLTRILYPQGFLWFAPLPGLLHALYAPFPLWLADWAATSASLLLLGLFLAAQGRPLASLFLLPPALDLGPWGLFLLGLLHGVNLLEGALSQGREGRVALALPPRALLLPLLLGLGMAGLAYLPFPASSLPLPHLSPFGPAEALGGGMEPGESAVYQTPEGGFPAWVGFLNRALGYALPLALALLLFSLWPLAGRGERLPYRGGHLLPLLMALLAFALFLLYLGTLGGGEGREAGTPPASLWAPGEGPRPEAIPGPRRLGEVGVALAGFSALLTLAFFSLLLLAVWRRSRGEGEVRAGARTAPRGQALGETLPEDRVRRAYLKALRALGAQGWPRQAWEGPLEYGERVARSFPEVRASLFALTRLYLPVRYGGGAGEGAAEQAEGILESILKLCSIRASSRP